MDANPIAATAAPAEVDAPNPDAGGSYVRNPATGELSPTATEPLPDEGGQAGTGTA